MSTFTAKPIGDLPAATTLTDGSMIPICQDGTAKYLTGAQIKQYLKDALENTPLPSAASCYELDLTEIVTVKPNDNPYTEGDDHFDLTGHVDAAALLDAVAAKKIIRIHFRDGFFTSKVVSTILTDVYVGKGNDDIVAYLGAVYLNMYNERYAKIRITVAYSDEAYQVGFSYVRDPGGTGGNNVHVVDANTSDVSNVDFSAYKKGDVVLVTMSS